MIKNNKELSYIKLKNFLHNKDSFKRGPFGSALKKAFFVESGYKVYEQKNAINKNNTIGEYYITEEKFKELESFAIKQGDIIISCSGTVGESYIIPKNSKEGVINQALLRIRTPDNVNHLFFNYLLKSNYMRKKFLEGSQGGVVKNLVSMKIFKDIEIPNFEKEEQDKIVEILDKQQSLINSYKEKLSLLEEQESYYQDELLSGRIRIKLNSENEKVAIDKGFIVNDELAEGKEKEFEEWLSVDFKDKVEFYKEDDFSSVNLNNRHYKLPKDWKIEKISDIFDVSRGKVLSKVYIQENKGVYPVYSSATENDGVIGNIDTYMYDGEYLTWTTDGIYAGKIFYRNGQFSATNVCGVLKLKNEGYNYNIIKFFAQPFFNINVNKVGNNKLMSNVVSNIEFLLPKVSIEQYLLNNFFNNINENKNIILEKIKIEEEKMDYLMDELLSGRIKVE